MTARAKRDELGASNEQLARTQARPVEEDAPLLYVYTLREAYVYTGRKEVSSLVRVTGTDLFLV